MRNPEMDNPLWVIAVLAVLAWGTLAYLMWRDRKKKERERAMSDKDYTGGPSLDLVAGTITGHRVFQLTERGVLAPVHRSGSWLPGENVCNSSDCHPDKYAPGFSSKAEDESWSDYQNRLKEWRDSPYHTLENCVHGFYAYFQGGGTHSNDTLLHGVIEGYGRVTIGHKGFRAEKARIIAISLTPTNEQWAVESGVEKKLRANYPSAEFYSSTMAMWERHPALPYQEPEAATGPTADNLYGYLYGTSSEASHG